MTLSNPSSLIRLALPKGRMQQGVFRLLSEAGVPVRVAERGYRPVVPLDGFVAKLLKPQAIVEMLRSGSRDLGFAGADWVIEREAPVVELVDTGLDKVSIVAAAPQAFLDGEGLAGSGWRVASEYPQLTQSWLERCGYDARFVRSYGATEVLPPEDADCIVDNTSTGETLRANRLVIFDTLMTSSTRLYASQAAMDDPLRRDRIEEFVLLIRSVLDARSRVMVELNVPEAALERVLDILPSMRGPTVSTLWGGGGVAVKSAVPRSELARLIPELKAAGGTDIVTTVPSQIVA